MKWFGKPYGCAYELDTPRVPVPVGEPCSWCCELIRDDDTGVILPLLRDDGLHHWLPQHYECHMRSIVGGLNHLRGKCACYDCDGVEPPDPPEMSKREAALAAVVQWGLLCAARAWPQRKK